MGKCRLLCGPESSETLVLLLRWSWIKQPASNAFLYWFPLLSCFAPLSVMSAAGVTSPGNYQHSHINCPSLCFLGDPSKMHCEKALIRPAVQMRNKSVTYLRDSQMVMVWAIILIISFDSKLLLIYLTLVVSTPDHFSMKLVNLMTIKVRKKMLPVLVIMTLMSSHIFFFYSSQVRDWETCKKTADFSTLNNNVGGECCLF